MLANPRGIHDDTLRVTYTSNLARWMHLARGMLPIVHSTDRADRKISHQATNKIYPFIFVYREEKGRDEVRISRIVR